MSPLTKSKAGNGGWLYLGSLGSRCWLGCRGGGGSGVLRLLAVVADVVEDIVALLLDGQEEGLRERPPHTLHTYSSWLDSKGNGPELLRYFIPASHGNVSTIMDCTLGAYMAETLLKL